MRTGIAWILAGLLGCTKAGPTQETVQAPTPESTFAQPPAAKLPPPAPVPMVTVAMTAATLADDCGGVSAPPAAGGRSEQRSRTAVRRADAACDQSSMQLSVIAPAGASPTQLTVKKVELYDDAGALLGELTPRTPTVWAQDGTYRPWDQQVAQSQELSVSYALSQPAWGDVTQRWNRTYVVKAVITVGGADRAVQRDVHVAAPAMLPPNVRT
ncbi:MAG: hypothetical protein H0T42_27835 [Deltaproteobacteria bacterium]|nr:hypothetical protein [Deltaproteobacteria bacterium]